MIDQPTAGDALARLRPLVGEWVVQVVTPGDPPTSVEYATTVAWHPAGAHLVVRTAMTTPHTPPGGVSIIGCDAANGTYTQLYSDERGVCRTYAMTIDERTWTLHRDGEPFAQRFLAEFADGGRMIIGRWDRAGDDGEWVTDFHVVYRWVGTPRAPDR